MVKDFATNYKSSFLSDGRHVVSDGAYRIPRFPGFVSHVLHHCIYIHIAT